MDLANRYEDGFLPDAGGWMDQDDFYVMLIQEALARKRAREKIEEESRQRAAARKRH